MLLKIIYKTTEAAKLLEHVDGDVVVSVMVDYIVEENCFRFFTYFGAF